MDTRHLRAFVAVAERRSFTIAAREMYMAQSTLSRQVAALETQLGSQLLDRTKVGVRLTHAGEVFLPHARDVLDALAQATEAVKQTRADHTSGACIPAPDMLHTLP